MHIRVLQHRLAKVFTMRKLLRTSSLASALVYSLIAVGSLSLSGCSTSSFMSSLAPYKVEVVQGNSVSREQVSQLKNGMSRDQVGDILGTPLLVSLFHADRWEYGFLMRRPGVEVQSRKLTVFFENDKLSKVEGDTMPSEAEFVDNISKKLRFGSVPKLELTDSEIQKYPVKQ